MANPRRMNQVVMPVDIAEKSVSGQVDKIADLMGAPQPRARKPEMVGNIPMDVVIDDVIRAMSEL